ncbi:hypothetical protein MBLNU459_g7265t1 [Dothideomycetes sp. NU459]
MTTTRQQQAQGVGEASGHGSTVNAAGTVPQQGGLALGIHTPQASMAAAATPPANEQNARPSNGVIAKTVGAVSTTLTLGTAVMHADQLETYYGPGGLQGQQNGGSGGGQDNPADSNGCGDPGCCDTGCCDVGGCDAGCCDGGFVAALTSCFDALISCTSS